MMLSNYLWADSYNCALKREEDSLAEAFMRLEEIIEYLEQHIHPVKVPSILYEQEIESGVTLMDWVFSEDEHHDMHDEKSLLQSLLKTGEYIEETDYLKILEKLENKQFRLNASLIGFYHLKETTISSDLVIYNSNGWFHTNRYYLGHSQSIHEFFQGFINCFPDLHFHPQVISTMQTFRPLHDFLNEIIKHLIVLNDYARTCFKEYSREGERTVLQRVKSQGIECSVQGDPDYEKKHLLFKFVNDEGTSEEVVCSPHTKLFSNHSSYRIYFHWGVSNVQRGEKLLIAHIGDHL